MISYCTIFFRERNLKVPNGVSSDHAWENQEDSRITLFVLKLKI